MFICFHAEGMREPQEDHTAKDRLEFISVHLAFRPLPFKEAVQDLLLAEDTIIKLGMERSATGWNQDKFWTCLFDFDQLDSGKTSPWHRASRAAQMRVDRMPPAPNVDMTYVGSPKIPRVKAALFFCSCLITTLQSIPA